MRIIQTEDYESMSKVAADFFLTQVQNKKDSVLGLATGSSPIGLYKYLVQWYQEGKVDFSQVKTINLDEYKGLTHDNPQSYYYFMMDNLFSHVNIKKENIHVPDGFNPNEEEACGKYDEIIESLGGCDIQLLGIGPDGHIGFNEPEDHFTLKTHCVKLEESTIEANKRFFASKEEVPTKAYTMGIETIMKAKKVIMIVNGSSKADIIKKAFQQDIVTPMIPASILKLHPDFTLIGDREALKELNQ